MLRVGWFSTGRGEGSRGLLRFVQQRIHEGRLDATIPFVFSNRAPGEAEGSDVFFQLVDSYNLPLVTYSSRQFARYQGGKLADHRVDYDRHVMRLLDGYDIDVCMLAGYMLIVGPEMWRRWPMLNLHPALPDGPKGTWQEVIWQLIENRADRTGAMIHLANDDLDRGPVVAYFTLPIAGPGFDPLWWEVGDRPVSELENSPGENLPLFRRIREEGYRCEPYLISETLQALALGKVALRDGGVAGPKGEAVQGVCLDKEITEALANR